MGIHKLGAGKNMCNSALYKKDTAHKNRDKQRKITPWHFLKVRTGQNEQRYGPPLESYTEQNRQVRPSKGKAAAPPQLLKAKNTPLVLLDF